MQPGGPQIQLMDVWKVFGEGPSRVEAVRGVSLTIHPGERVVFAGPSGSGKTTLLHLMSGLEAPTRGEVIVEGHRLTGMEEEAITLLRLRRMGFVFQAFNLIPVLSAWENAEIVLLMLGVNPEERARRLRHYFRLLGLSGLESRRPSRMSGGQQQRVAVIRAIAHRPAVVFLDEPTANLDSENAENLLRLLSRLNEEEGITLVFSSHDPLVMAYAHRVVYLRDGRVQRDERRVPGGSG